MLNSGPTMEQIKTGMRATWMAGDFGVIAKTIGASAGEPFAAQIALRPGAQVLDVACGTGNVTIPLARRGATVTGLDLAPNLLVQARARAAAEGLPIRFDEGDAEALPYPDGAFDVVSTMFGAMFAPRPEVVAAEMARVLRPGGTLAMANWTPSGFPGRCSRLEDGMCRRRPELCRRYFGATLRWCGSGWRRSLRRFGRWWCRWTLLWR